MMSPSPSSPRRRARRLWPWLLLCPLLLLLMALALALQTQPRVQPDGGGLSPAQIQSTKDFLRRNDPRRSDSGRQRLLRIDEAQLNLMLMQLAQRYGQGRAAAQIQLQAGSAQLQASVPLTGLWLNLEAELSQTADLPQIERLRLGRLPLPAWLARPALRRLLANLALPSQAQAAGALVETLRFLPQELQLGYHWQADSLDQVLGALWTPAEQARAQAYNQRLTELSAAYPPGSPVSLALLLPPIFELARARSEIAEADPVAENRAALLTLALFSTGQHWSKLLPSARAWPQAQSRMVTLAERDDFPQHFLISAVLALEGSGPLADAIGVYKEVADTRGGSGFSFNDIAADRAGSRFGMLARQAPRSLQTLMRAGLQEGDFMPSVADLPEFLSAAAFRQRYGGLDAPAYRQMMAEIDARIAALPLLQSAQGKPL